MVVVPGGGGGGAGGGFVGDAGIGGDSGPAVGPGPAVGVIPVRIVNPAATNFALSYSIDGQSYSLPSGRRRPTMCAKRGDRIRPRPGHGRRQIRPAPGTYTFESTPKGWDLFQGDKPPAPVVTVRIVNPTSTQTTLNYSIDGQLYHLEPGQSQDVNAAPDATIEFGRGQDLGVARYGLRSGTFSFKSTSNGWDLDPAENLAVRPAPSPSPK